MTSELRRLWNALPQDFLGGTKHTFNGEWQTVLGQKTIYTGDDVKLGTINLFRRAWNEDPLPASDGNGEPEEKELAANVGIRLAVAANDRDNTGDDLNLVVMLLMSILRFPSERKPTKRRVTKSTGKSHSLRGTPFSTSSRSKACRKFITRRPHLHSTLWPASSTRKSSSQPWAQPSDTAEIVRFTALAPM
jgi:hypothetical protein